MYTTILAAITFAIFIIYNSVAIGLFGIPTSLSDTYYLYENKKEGMGWLFTVFMWLMAFLLIPCWVVVSDAVGPWMSYFSFLAFIAAACIMFVGAAPKFRDRYNIEKDVHMYGAKVCAAAALAWCFVVCWNIWYVPIIAMLVPVVEATVTKSWKDKYTYWLEMMAFDATFATIIVESCIV